MGALSLHNLTRRPTPGLPFAKVAQLILPRHDISLVFVGSARAKSLNRRLRNKVYVPNVLSYEVGTNSSEVIICLERVDKEATSFGMTPKTYCLFLFIHGLLHLKGYRHSATMEKRERELLARIVSVPLRNETTNSNRHRSRLSSNESRRR